MALGLGVLRLAPQNFWSMTPRELERALSVLQPRPAAPGRDRLRALMDAFPDREVDGG